MDYKYCEDRNFEDFACGKVIVHKNGYPSFPVRLAQEIFSRCVSYLPASADLCLYDPCCGGGYLLTVLGFLNLDTLHTIMGSDVSRQAVALAQANLSLLQPKGMDARIQQVRDLSSMYHKPSHAEAVESAERLRSLLANADRLPQCGVFQADILSDAPFAGQSFRADIVFTDVPYGNLVSWETEGQGKNNLLENLIPVLRDTAVVAICSDKSQKFGSPRFTRLEKQVIGKRIFQIFKMTQP